MTNAQHSPDPMPLRFAISTWGAALAHCRINYRRGEVSHRDLANFCGVKRAVLKEWEQGRGFPTTMQLKKIYKRGLHDLRAYENLLPKDDRDRIQADLDPTMPPALLPAPPTDPQAVDPPRTFGAALKLARQVEGLDQSELGDLMDVSDSAVSNWETGGTTPVRDNYNKLLALFPHLADAPLPPGIKDYPKPTGPQGMTLAPKDGPAPLRVPIGERVESAVVTALRVEEHGDVALAPPPSAPRGLDAIIDRINAKASAKVTDVDAAGIAYARALAAMSEAQTRLAAHQAAETALHDAVARAKADVQSCMDTLVAAARRTP